MRAKCTWCSKYRQLRGSPICDECSEEHWFQIDGDLWLRDMREFGFATFRTDRTEVPTGAEYDAWRVALVVEYDWSCAEISVTPLWDTPPRRKLTPAERVAQRHRRST